MWTFSCMFSPCRWRTCLTIKISLRKVYRLDVTATWKILNDISLMVSCGCCCFFTCVILCSLLVMWFIFSHFYPFAQPRGEVLFCLNAQGWWQVTIRLFVNCHHPCQLTALRPNQSYQVLWGLERYIKDFIQSQVIRWMLSKGYEVCGCRRLLSVVFLLSNLRKWMWWMFFLE